ncbi:hypothetical protein DFJ73DRAFT_416385 [Zopfochytrium polystomum]|nr:hypothetical protein DFJ73DRAFT_416385 [Zopfochytrium polystomum]
MKKGSFQPSKYRNLLLKEAKKELHFTWQPGQLTDGVILKASPELLAVRVGQSGLSFADVNGTTTRRSAPTAPTISNGTTVTDLDWGFPTSADHGHRLLVTGADDGLKVWSVPRSGLTEVMTVPSLRLASGSAVSSVAFHPTASETIIASSKGLLQFFDVNRTEARLTLTAGDSIQSFAVRQDGSLTASASKDNYVKIFDPRSSTSNPLQSVSAHVGTKPTKILFLGDDPLLLSVGFSKARDREFALWDIRSLASPIILEKLDSSPGVITPLYDPDTRLLLLSGKGDTIVRWFDVTQSTSTKLNPGPSPLFVSTSLTSVALVPKVALDVMSCEVVRLLATSSDGSSVIPISGTVPRKSTLEFHSDLFPDTAGDTPALTAGEWFAGANARATTVSLDPSKRKASMALESSSGGFGSNSEIGVKHLTQSASLAPPTSAVLSSPSNSTKITLADDEGSHRAEAMVVPPEAQSSGGPSPPTLSATVAPSALPIRRTIVKNMDFTLESHSYDLKGSNAGTTNESRGFDASSKLTVFPLQGPGGRLGIWPTAVKGRMPVKIPTVVCGADVCDFQLDPFESTTLYTLSDDGMVRVWKLSEIVASLQAGRTVDDMMQPTDSFRAHSGRSSFILVHPTVRGLLLTASPEMNAPVLKVWDVDTKSVVASFPHPQAILSVAVSPDGRLCATCAKDKTVRAFDLRSGKTLSEGASHDGTKAARALWLGNSEHLLTVGFGRANRREVRIFNATNLKSPIITSSLDTSPSVLVPFYDNDLQLLYLSGKGESFIETFYVDIRNRQVTKVNRASLPTIQSGVVFAPKHECNVRIVEVAKAYRLVATGLDLVSFTVPRLKKDYFQDDLFPPYTFASGTSVSAWRGGADVAFSTMNLQPKDLAAVSSIQKITTPQRPKHVFSKELTQLEKRVELMRKMGERANDDDYVMPQDKFEGVEDSEWD